MNNNINNINLKKIEDIKIIYKKIICQNKFNLYFNLFIYYSYCKITNVFSIVFPSKNEIDKELNFFRKKFLQSLYNRCLVFTTYTAEILFILNREKILKFIENCIKNNTQNNNESVISINLFGTGLGSILLQYFLGDLNELNNKHKIKIINVYLFYVIGICFYSVQKIESSLYIFQIQNDIKINIFTLNEFGANIACFGGAALIGWNYYNNFYNYFLVQKLYKHRNYFYNYTVNFNDQDINDYYISTNEDKLYLNKLCVGQKVYHNSVFIIRSKIISAIVYILLLKFIYRKTKWIYEMIVFHTLFSKVKYGEKKYPKYYFGIIACIIWVLILFSFIFLYILSIKVTIFYFIHIIKEIYNLSLKFGRVLSLVTRFI